MKRVLLCLLFICSIIPLFAEDIKDEKNLQVTPLVGPAYTPELGLLIAGGGLFSFSTQPENKSLQRSSFPVTLGVSTTGAVVFTGNLTSFWLDDRMRINASMNLKNMPDNYWGVGYDKNSSIEKGEDTTEYDRFWWQFNPKTYFKVTNNFYTGFNWDLNFTDATNLSDGVSTDEDFIEFGNRNFNHGVGIALLYDSRDVAVNAWSGIYGDLKATFYSPYLGGDNKYQIYEADYRQYQQIKRDGSTIAWQGYMRYGVGDVPYGELSQVGSPFDLRGYSWGQYRDKVMLYSLVEYRHIFLKKSGELSPHGLVLWGGIGSIGEDITDMSQPLLNAGFGYRLEVQPRMNVRVDFGFGDGTFGFYFNFNESF